MAFLTRILRLIPHTRTINRHILRNLVFFSVLLLTIIGSFMTIFVNGRNELNLQNEQIVRSYTISIEVKKLRRLVTQQELYFYDHAYAVIASSENAYLTNKSELIDSTGRLVLLVGDTPEQLQRARATADSITRFIALLDKAWPEENPHLYLERISELQRSIDKELADFYTAETALLKKRQEQMNSLRNDYYANLIICGSLGALLLIAFNGFLFYVQFRRMKAEIALQDTAHRHELALLGASDGIFDMIAGEQRAVYSPRFFEILGRPASRTAMTFDELSALVHPDDRETFLANLATSFDNPASEYSDTYRLSHSDGRWIWVNSRGRMIRDSDRNVMRLIGATTDITYMRRYQEKVENEKEQALKADRAKSAFLAHMSHEIRTPLTAIVGAADILARRQENLTGRQIRMIEVLRASSISLRELVTGILDFSRIESGELTLDIRPSNLEEILHQIRLIASVTAQEKNLHFSISHSPIGETPFMSDATRLRQILVNLVGNALKFTALGSVTLTADTTEIEGSRFLSIAVMDTGTGIAPENLEKIFERFQQEDSSISLHYGGSGLGLSISRDLARLMGGSIRVESVQGAGSTFTLLIPLKLEAETHNTISETGDPDSMRGRKHADRMHLLSANRRHILIADDYDGNIIILSSLLDDAGLSHDVARNGQEAVELWKKHHYDLILIDVKMPVLDGYAAARQIREMEKQEHMPHTPIVCMTAHAMMESRADGLAVGMDGFLDKPISADDLMNMIGRYIRHTAA